MNNEKENPEVKTQKIKIFISKKETDEIAAKRIKSKLLLYGGDRLMFLTSQDIPTGADWFNWIKESLTDSDVLFLLFTDPATSWDWCLYEVGMFTPLSERPEKPIICLHTPFSEPPSPLKHLQAVKGELAAMKDFLVSLFGTDKIIESSQPINKNFAENDEELTAVAEYICESLSPSSMLNEDRVYYTRHIDLLVDPEQLSKDEIPADTVVKADPLSLEIFGLLGKPPGGGDWTWEKLIELMVEQQQAEWIKEFTESVSRACRNQFLQPPHETLRSLTSNKCYRAVIHRREFVSDDLVNLRVLFIHQPSDNENTVPANMRGMVPSPQ